MKKRWKTNSIDQVCSILNGGTPKTKVTEYWDGNILWITPKDMGRLEQKYVHDTQRKITDLGLSKSSAKIIPSNSIILSSRAPIGHLAINSKPMATNQGCKGLVPSKSINTNYLYYFLKANVELLNDLGTGATFKELSTKVLGGVQIPTPTLEEQKQIVVILDQAFEAIDQAKANLEKNIQNTRELFVSKLNEIFFQNNNDWEERKLGDVYDVRDGTHDSPRYQESGFPLITSKNLKRGIITYDKVKYISDSDYHAINKRSKVHIGDVLFAMIGTIGNPVVIINEPNFSIKNVALFKVPSKQNSLFLKYFLDSPLVLNKMLSEAKGATQKFVGLGYLRDFKIKIPSFETQIELVKKLDKLKIQIDNIEHRYIKKQDGLEDLKKSILQKAFLGELAS